MQVSELETGETNLPSSSTNVESESLSVTIQLDPCTWKNKSMTKNERDLIVLKGPVSNPKHFPRDSNNRIFPKNIFCKRLINDESVQRDWLVWSAEAQALFCFPCCLFYQATKINNSSSQLCASGLSGDYRKLYQKIAAHENNPAHKDYYIQWKEAKERLSAQKCIDEELQQQIRIEERKWQKILHAVLDVVLFLGKNNLAFRGTESKVGAENPGLFLSMIDLVSKYSPELRHHLDTILAYQKSGKRMQAHYLSWESQNEFLELCGNKIFQSILEDVKCSRYFGIVVDGTPDVSHNEQLIFIIRCVVRENEWIVREYFLKMVDFEKKKGEDISDEIERVLKDCSLDLNLCRGQGYDNASNMSGKFSGVQARILKKNPQAYYTPCVAHTLNLCGVHAMETSVQGKIYFGNIQKLYTVFAASPARWKILEETANLSLHKLSTTRWSARVEAVRPLTKNYRGILDSLFKIQELTGLTSDIQAEVNFLIDWFQSFDFILMTTWWFKILHCLDETNKLIQSPKLNLKDAGQHIHNLCVEIQRFRDSWEEIISEAKAVASSLNIPVELKAVHSRIRMRKCFPDESREPEATFSTEESKFKTQVFFPMIDRLVTELRDLDARTNEMSKLFDPILIAPASDENEDNENDDFWKESAKKLKSAYPKDLDDEDQLIDEMKLLQKIRRNLKWDDGMRTNIDACDLLNLIYAKEYEAILPQICICLRLLLTLVVSVASGERGFSKLALIKNRLRSTMTQSRLNHLLHISIEHEKASTLNFGEIIQMFAAKRARKVHF